MKIPKFKVNKDNTKFIDFTIKIKAFSKEVFENLEIIIISILLFVSPFVVNYNDLPKGYELAKVTFLQIGTIALFTVFVLKELYKLFRSKKLKIDRSLAVPLAFITLIIITTALSPFQNIALYGNQFRFQGAITHILMVIFAFIVYKKTTTKNIKLFFWAFFLSAIFQSIVSFGQLRYFIETNFKVIFEGYYINGTFGQANFYSGRIMLGILSGIFLISLDSSVQSIKSSLGKLLSEFLHYFLLPILILTLIVGLIISFSTWGIITTGVMVLVLITYELVYLFSNPKSSRNIFGYLFGIFLSLFLIISGYYLYTLYRDQYDNIRLHIWREFYALSTNDSILRVLIGYGYDTLAEVFKKLGIFRGLYVDRGHNFFLDIYSQNGLITLLLFLGVAITSVFKFIFKKSSRILVYAFIGMFFWLFRSFIHESGIVNLFDFLVLFGAVLALQKNIKLDLKLPKLINHKGE